MSRAGLLQIMGHRMADPMVLISRAFRKGRGPAGLMRKPVFCHQCDKFMARPRLLRSPMAFKRNAKGLPSLAPRVQ